MQITIDVITNPREILRSILESEDNQSIIGISSSELGPGIFMTTVKEIIAQGEDLLIVVNSYDLTGYFLEKNRLLLSRITGIIPFKAVFTNPFLKEVIDKQKQEEGDQTMSTDYLF
jgi:hypothetical protein